MLKSARWVVDEMEAYDEIENRKLRVEMRLLGTLRSCIANMRDADTELRGLVFDIEAALAEGRKDLLIVGEVGELLEEEITCLRPRIRAACDYVLDMKSLPLLNLTSYDLWNELSLSLHQNLMDLYRWEGGPTELSSLVQKLESLSMFLRGVESQSSRYQDLLNYFGALIFRAVHLCYLCWTDDKLMAGEMGVLFIDLQTKFKPDNPQVTELCLQALRVPLSFLFLSADERAQHFVNLLIPENNPNVARLRTSLTCLITFSIVAPVCCNEEDVKLLRMHITATVSEVPSITGDYLLAPFHLLERIELLKAEVLLMEILNAKTTSSIFVKDRIKSLNVVLRFLEKGSIQNSFPHKYDDSVVRLSQLLHKIKLSKTEVLLRELMNSHPSLKFQVETLCLEIIFLMTFLKGPLEENAKVILRRVESVASDAGSIYYSLHASNSREDVVRKFNILLPEIMEKFKLVNAEIKEIYLRIRSSSCSNFPKTCDGLGFINFILENLRELLEYQPRGIASVRHQIIVVYREMETFRSIVMDIEKQCKEDSDIKTLCSRIVNLAYEAEYLIDSVAIPDGIFWYHRLWLSDLIEEMKEVTKIKASEISSKEVVHKGIGLQVPQSERKVLLAANNISKDDDVVVELDDQMTLMIDKLTRGSRQRDVVSITGLPGLGKTTLAKKLYQHPKVTHHFHIRACCAVSPSYQKRELLLQILGDITQRTDDILEMDDDDLDLELYQSLKRKTYLIILDDLWNTEAWNDIETSLPNDKNGSRILITSRLPDVVSKIRAESIPHPLRLLSDVESWALLQKKLFQTKDCPAELMVVGKQIAESCKGLPLAVVAISGLLGKTDMKPDSWKKIEETLSSHVASDQEMRCRDILELSYRHLPNYLRPCFLYLGAFMQDKEIPVRKLTRLWVAEGLAVQNNTELKSAEEVAEEYFKDLVGRSLVITSKRRSDGGVKTCCVHDMLRALCLLKCREERFCQCVAGYEEIFAASPEDSDYGVAPNYRYPTNSITYEKCRLSICSKRNHFVVSRPRGPQVRSLLALICIRHVHMTSHSLLTTSNFFEYWTWNA